MARQGITGVAEYLASQGRNGDNAVAHVTSGETIIPKELVDKYPSLKQEINASFQAEEVDPAQYMVGSGVMSINPETGMPEFGWLSKTWKSVRKTVKKAGPVIGAVIDCDMSATGANIRQWHHTLDTQQLLDADSDGDDDLRLTKPSLDNAHELMTG